MRSFLALAVLIGLPQEVSLPDQDETAPDAFRVRFETSKGAIVVNVTRAWAPKGADRFYTLVKSGYFSEARFYRVKRKYVAQFGYAADPKASAHWREKPLEDDPVKESNLKGRLTFAKSGPNTRTTQIFINLRDSKSLDRKGFAPFGEVAEGMDVVESLHWRYGDRAKQQKIFEEGNAYLAKAFEDLDYIKTASLVENDQR